VSEVALDASVVLKWFRSAGERNVEAARGIRSAYEEGDLVVWVPPLLRLEILNVAGRCWKLGEAALVELAGALEDLGFEQLEPPLERVAHWIARGLTAYDAAYVAVAETAAVKLVTDDAVVLAIAQEVAEPLAPSTA
jgi:predicted nucleic acid-binding protein